MSVLRSKRNLAPTEFENAFANLYHYSIEQTTKISKRKHKWLCTNIDRCMNELYRDLMWINESYNPNKTVMQQDKMAVAQNAANKLNLLAKPLIVLWNIEGYDMKHMTTWYNQINIVLLLLNKMHDGKKVDNQIMVLDKVAINKMKFLKNMSELHRYTYGKVIHAKSAYDSTHGSLLIQLVDDAFYNICLANKTMPKTKSEYEDRRKLISNAISDLKQMNRSLTFYFNLMQYSERVMIEWSEMLSEELKMLYGLQKSDKKRFKDLI